VIVGVDPPEPDVWRTAVRVRRGSLEVSGDGRVIASGEQDAINFTGAPAHLRLRDRGYKATSTPTEPLSRLVQLNGRIVSHLDLGCEQIEMKAHHKYRQRRDPDGTVK
jgi:hypothetical protein